MPVFIFCSRDYLNVTYEHDQKSKVYCGNKTGWKVEVTGNYIMTKFHSDDSHHKRGFLIYFIAIPRREYHSFLAQKEIWFFFRNALHYCNTSILLLSAHLGMDCSIPVLFPSPQLPTPPPPPLVNKTIKYMSPSRYIVA